MRKMISVIIISVFLFLGKSTTCMSQISLPEKYSFSFGGGAVLSYVTAVKSNFFSKHDVGNGYNLCGELKMYDSFWGFGISYDYLRAIKHTDKMHVNYICPNISFRYLFDENKHDFYFGVGIGYLGYQERIYSDIINTPGHLYYKGYCGLSFTLGYEFAAYKGINGNFKINIITADWFLNPDGRLCNLDGYDYLGRPYDDGINHHWFKNDITFVNFSLSLMLGK